MATPTDGEPRPRDPILPWSAPARSSSPRHALPRPGELPPRWFQDVLQSRGSKPLVGTASEGALSSLLWHAMLLRERRGRSRDFLEWESRACPSAGGLHAIRLLILPVNRDFPLGVYDPLRHEVASLEADPAPLLAANASSVERLCGSQVGTTLQFVADRSKVDAAYVDGESLLWRDSGALAATLALVAEALLLSATPLGRAGNGLLRLAGFADSRWTGAGAVHVTGGSAYAIPPASSAPG